METESMTYSRAITEIKKHFEWRKIETEELIQVIEKYTKEIGFDDSRELFRMSSIVKAIFAMQTFIESIQSKSESKTIDQYYEEWSGKHHTINACKPVHDSAECCDFAQYYYNEINGITAVIHKTDFLGDEYDEVECCKIAPITNENFCPNCGRKIVRL
jgi:hypothetical protein